ncbi:class I SAM-dependent methyltransferase [Arthrobacter monumenti]
MGLIDPGGLRVADVGCGGGIYSTSWLELGAELVTGIDSSQQMIDDALARADEYPNLHFAVGDAADTGLPTASFDLVFQRALVHHLQDTGPGFGEARRLLVPGGTLMIQDRTMSDVCKPGSSQHLRGYFFELYPRLVDFESQRRPEAKTIETALRAAGFTDVKTRSIPERRRTYSGINELALDLSARTGRSILHELSDQELQILIDYIGGKLNGEESIDEIDHWTIWTATNPAE